MGSNPIGLILDTFLFLFIVILFFKLAQAQEGLGARVGKTIFRSYHKKDEEDDFYERTFIHQDHKPFFYLDIGENNLPLEARILAEVTHHKVFKENQFPKKGEGVKFHYPLDINIKQKIGNKHEYKYISKLKKELRYIDYKDKK